MGVEQIECRDSEKASGQKEHFGVLDSSYLWHLDARGGYL